MAGAKKLDIRFIPIDSDNPYAIVEPFSEENVEMITSELHEKLGHLCDDISETGGHIKVYTQGNAVVAQPQFVNFSKKVWDKIHSPYVKPLDIETGGTVRSVTDDYLDHESYNDL